MKRLMQPSHEPRMVALADDFMDVAVGECTSVSLLACVSPASYVDCGVECLIGDFAVAITCNIKQDLQVVVDALAVVGAVYARRRRSEASARKHRYDS